MSSPKNYRARDDSGGSRLGTEIVQNRLTC
jgi:hypothetical protein